MKWNKSLSKVLQQLKLKYFPGTNKHVHCFVIQNMCTLLTYRQTNILKREVWNNGVAEWKQSFKKNNGFYRRYLLQKWIHFAGSYLYSEVIVMTNNERSFQIQFLNFICCFMKLRNPIKRDIHHSFRWIPNILLYLIVSFML